MAAVLLHNWRWFGPAGEGSLRGLLGALLLPLSQPDLALFRHALATLQQLHARHKLYARAPFSEGFLPAAQSVLLRVLCAKTHALLAEEICAALYDMAAADFPAFFHGFLPAFLAALAPPAPAEKAALLAAFAAHDTVRAGAWEGGPRRSCSHMVAHPRPCPLFVNRTCRRLRGTCATLSTTSATTSAAASTALRYASP